jgi:hypothetical protein
MVPWTVMFVRSSRPMKVPDSEFPDCESCHVRIPGPVLSDALPVQVPDNVGVVDGTVASWVGEVGDGAGELLLHDVAISMAAATTQSCASRRLSAVCRMNPQRDRGARSPIRNSVTLTMKRTTSLRLRQDTPYEASVST